MELLLNLSWLLLAMPAFWLWRGARGARGQRRFSALQGMFALAAALVLLFPVVSATDDLRAMRAEMEESQTSKRSMGQSGGDKSSASRSQAQPAFAVSVHLPVSLEGHILLAVPLSVSTLAFPRLVLRGRAPPQSAKS